MSQAIAPDTIEMRIGRTVQNCTLCFEGRARIQAVNGVLGYKSSDRAEETALTTEHIVARKPSVFCRFTKNGKMTRPELGKFLLGAERPVRHVNGDPLDFRLENLEQIPEREKKEVETKTVGDAASRPLNEPDGKTADEQIELLASLYPALLEKARKILRDPRPSASYGATEGRAGEVVADMMPGLIERIRAGKIRDVIRAAFSIIEVQATKERKRKERGFSPIQPDPGVEHLMARIISEQAPSNPDKSFFFSSSDNGRTVDMRYNMSAKKPGQNFYEDQAPTGK